jgi:DNA-binding transcriptional MerR regulator
MPKNPTLTSQISPMQSTGFPPAQMRQIPKEQEIQMLEDQAGMLGQQLQQIKKRIEELGKMK